MNYGQLKKIDKVIKDSLDYTIFPWSKQDELKPIHIERAEGVYFYDQDGKRYLDFSSQLMTVNIGHGNRKIATAIAKQMEKVSYVHPGKATTEAKSKLGKKLSQIAPEGMNKTLFTLGGSDANDAAIMIAKYFTGKEKIIARYRSYHGATHNTLSAGGDPRKFAFTKQSAPGMVHVEDPYCYRCPWSQKIETCKRECVSHIERVINFEGPENVAAIIMEGASGGSGCIKYPPDYLEKVAALAKKYGILLIVDEVMSGFCRTGKWFAVSDTGVKPDIITMGKGLTSGYLPLGGVILSDEIASFLGKQMFTFGLTYSGHPVSCAAALACLEEYEDNDIIENVREIGKCIEYRLKQMKEIHPSIGDIRMTGLLGCIELVKNRETKEPLIRWNAKPEEQGIIKKMNQKLLELGVFASIKWNMIFIAPPLIINKEQVDESLKKISEVLKIADGEYRH